MSVFLDLFNALSQQDFQVLARKELMWALYTILFLVIFLENGLLPASFLPGDSLVLLTGTLIAQGALHYPGVLLVLTVASALGGWLSFAQGRWLGNTKLVQGWLEQLPPHYHQRAELLFNRHGLSALLVARFLAFIRTIMPLIAGLSTLQNRRFQLFNWLSGFIWISSIVTVGYLLASTPLFRHYEHYIMQFLMLLPRVLLISGGAGAVFVVVRKKLKNRQDFKR